jgi:hypothetical protein
MASHADLWVAIAAAAPVLALAHFALIVPTVRQATTISRASLRIYLRELKSLPSGANPEPLFNKLNDRSRKHSKSYRRNINAAVVSVVGGVLAAMAFIPALLSLKFDHDMAIWWAIGFMFTSFVLIIAAQVFLLASTPWDVLDEIENTKTG